MEIHISTKQILKALELVSWVIFTWLCVEAGGIIFSTIYTFAINAANASTFWPRADLSSLFAFDQGHFMVIVIYMTIVAVLKAILFYLIVKLFVGKKLDMSQPFSTALRRFLVKVAYLAIGIGMFSHMGCEYSKWLVTQNVQMPDMQTLHLSGDSVWFFMAVILFMVSQIVKRGIEIQTENDLTI